MGSLAFRPSGLNVSIFEGTNCQGKWYCTGSLLYGQELVWGETSDWTNGLNFTSFNISRPLEDYEQLDINKMGQDSGQTRFWNCGAYLMNYGAGTAAGCHDIANGGVASCVRLWHY